MHRQPMIYDMPLNWLCVCHSALKLHWIISSKTSWNGFCFGDAMSASVSVHVSFFCLLYSNLKKWSTENDENANTQTLAWIFHSKILNDNDYIIAIKWYLGHCWFSMAIYLSLFIITAALFQHLKRNGTIIQLKDVFALRWFFSLRW